MGKNKALDWAKICAESNGTSILIPDELKERAKTLLKEVEDVNELNMAFSRKDADLEVSKTNFWHEVRKFLEAKGNKNAFVKTGIDFDADALKDGFYIVNLYDANMGGPMRRMPFPKR